MRWHQHMSVLTIAGSCPLRGWGSLGGEIKLSIQRASTGAEGCPNILGNRPASYGCPFIHRLPCLGTNFLCRTEPGQQSLQVPGELDTLTPLEGSKPGQACSSYAQGLVSAPYFCQTRKEQGGWLGHPVSKASCPD